MTSYRIAAALGVLLIACSTRAPYRVVPAPGAPAARPAAPPAASSGRAVRVALAAGDAPRVSATDAMLWLDEDARRTLARGRRGEQWRLERESGGDRVRAVATGGATTSWQRALVARSGGLLTFDGRRYRGELRVLTADAQIVIVNRLDLEDYLRGVVPAEMGSRPPGDSAALRAQAVASRSYAFLRSRDGGGSYDVRATVADQVYGGVDVENTSANAAIDATAGLVLWYAGRVVDAPFHSTCGGSTAEADEVWRRGGAPYLQRVSDRVGGSDRFYCDNAPRFRWTRTFTGSELDAALAQYLAAYASVPADGPGQTRAIAVGSRTPSGRAATLELETDKGIFTVRGNDIRYVMRAPGGEILASTYFSVEPEYREGRVSRVTFRGQGNGHGIGMCQWGAIGRARAGQSFRSILATYYPGTSVGPITVQ